jgi:esterase/lipase superfamily enzyme
MPKEIWSWGTGLLPLPARLVRWGHFGAPVLIFPTAGGDCEEIERFQLIAALQDLIDKGRVKVYSVDALATRAWLDGRLAPPECAALEDRFGRFLREEALGRIREDCRDAQIEPILAGASLGASTAVSTLSRYPDGFKSALGLSGVYDLAKRFAGVPGEAVGAFSPASLADLTGPIRQKLRRRSIVLGSGAGDFETPAQSQQLADALTTLKVPCQLSLWGPTSGHTWSTWRAMLPQALAQLL